MGRENFVFKPGLKDDGKPLIDFRTIPLRAILKLDKLPALPTEYDANKAVGGFVDNNMFGNDQYGCCVIAAQAHDTLVFERFEQGIVIPITRDDVINEYLRQSGGRDTGLYLTCAMKEWRKTGWEAAGKHYDIYAFASADPADHTQIKYSIYLLNGVIFGMKVYSTDIDQFRKNEPWHLTGSNGTFEGGHGVYAYAYKTAHYDCPHCNTDWAEDCITGWAEDSLICNTWGEEQPMDWDFWNARVNQAFAVVDNKNKWLGDSPLNIPLMESYLKEITGSSGDNPGCPCPAVGRILRKVLGVR